MNDETYDFMKVYYVFEQINLFDSERKCICIIHISGRAQITEHHQKSIRFKRNFIIEC